MSLTLSLPVFHSDFETIVIDTLLIEVGQKVCLGMEMLSCTVDIGGISGHDCPSQMSYSVVAAEAGEVHEVCVAPGCRVAHGQPIAVVKTGGTSSRNFRVMTAAIIRAELW